MICNRNGITSVGRWEFVKAFVEDFVAILVAIHFATPFATKNDRENFVEISSKISLLQLKFDEISTKFWTKFRRFFLWQNVVAKRFATRKISSKRERGRNFALWQNVLPQHFATKKIVEILSKISLLQFKFWRNPNEILTKEFVAKSCGKTFCHKAPDEKSDEILTKWKRKKQQRKSLYQNILQVVGNHGGVRSQYIYNYEFSHPLYMIFTFQTPFIGDVTLPMFDYYRGYWGWKSCYFLYIGIYRQTLPTLEDFKKCQPGFINLTLFRWISLGCCNFNTNLLLIER